MRFSIWFFSGLFNIPPSLYVKIVLKLPYCKTLMTENTRGVYTCTAISRWSSRIVLVPPVAALERFLIELPQTKVSFFWWTYLLTKGFGSFFLHLSIARTFLYQNTDMHIDDVLVAPSLRSKGNSFSTSACSSWCKRGCQIIWIRYLFYWKSQKVPCDKNFESLLWLNHPIKVICEIFELCNLF